MWIYVGGTFDLFHYGHARFLEQCASRGKVIVAINTDDFCERYKRKPVLTLGERIESVRSCKWVDEVIVNVGDEDTGLTIDLVKDKKISYIAHGDDWMGPALMSQLGITQEWLDKREIQMLYIPYTAGVSTSEIIRRIGGNLHSNCDCSCGCSGDGTHAQLAPRAK
jgi:glycerol-3-phosphate cytidylyltransferase